MVCCGPSDSSIYIYKLASNLLDGSSPAIDTSTSEWASQLVTVRKSDGIPGIIPFDYVVLHDI